jgi:predicted Fe-Mo cluster-binding NifX family protein
VVPVLDGSGLDAQISGHFGRAPYFLVVDLDENGRIMRHKVVQNVRERFGGSGGRADSVLQLEPNAIIVYGMGVRGLSIFQNNRVAVLQTRAGTARKAFAEYKQNKLEELTEGCREARHP